MKLAVNGEEFVLDHRKALSWPRRSALFIADPHFGKSAVFRREGIALPEGSDEEDLATLSGLLEDYRPAQLFILGDFVHGALAPGHAFYRQFRTWRGCHADTGVHLVLGNHDRHLDRRELTDVFLHSRLRLDNVVLVHDPDPAEGAFYLAGHIHPVARLSTRADSLRMPVFWQRENGIVLPSFGALTGGFTVSAARKEALFAVGPGIVTRLTP